MDTLDQILDNLWTSDYVQANPNKSYKSQYNSEYLAVAEYMQGGDRPSTTNWSKMGRVLVGLEDQKRAAEAPVPEPEPEPEPPPTGTKLRWRPPDVSGSNDLRIQTPGKVTGYSITGKRNVAWIAGHVEDLSNPSSGGHIILQNNSGMLHFEGIKGNVAGDCFGARYTNFIIQIVGCDIQVTDAGTTAHADCFQTQYLTCEELRCDRGTFRTDYQGFFLSNEPQRPDQPLPSKVGKFILSNWNFRPGPGGYPATFVFKAIPQRQGAQPLGPWELTNVWMPDNNPLYRVYPAGNFVDWAGAAYKFGCFLEQRKHSNGQTYKFVRFSTAADKVPSGPYAGQACGDCGIGGDGGIWLHPESGGPPGGDFAPADVGVGYRSPGYA